MTDKQPKSKTAMNWTVLGMAALSLAAAATNYLETKTQALKAAQGQAQTLAQLETNYATMKKAVEGLETGAKEASDDVEKVREALAEIRGVLRGMGVQRNALRSLSEKVDAEPAPAPAAVQLPERMPAPPPERVEHILKSLKE